MNQNEFMEAVSYFMIPDKEIGEWDEIGIHMDEDKIISSIENIIKKGVNGNKISLRDNNQLYAYRKSNGSWIILYSLEDKHYYFKNQKWMMQRTGELINEGWKTIPLKRKAQVGKENHRFIERGWPIGDISKGAGWGVPDNVNQVMVLKIPFINIYKFINWANENPMDVKG